MIPRAFGDLPSVPLATPRRGLTMITPRKSAWRLGCPVRLTVESPNRWVAPKTTKRQEVQSLRLLKPPNTLGQAGSVSVRSYSFAAPVNSLACCIATSKVNPDWIAGGEFGTPSWISTSLYLFFPSRKILACRVFSRFSKCCTGGFSRR